MALKKSGDLANGIALFEEFGIIVLYSGKIRSSYNYFSKNLN